MLETISIENYKSIEKLTLRLGRINVFIGENGAGKSNILEAIAVAGAAQADKLDNEFLTSRGIRVTGPQLMRSALRPVTGLFCHRRHAGERRYSSVWTASTVRAFDFGPPMGGRGPYRRMADFASRAPSTSCLA